MATDFDYDQLFPGRFIKAGLFQGKQMTLTIADVRIERLPDKKGTKKAGESEPCKSKPILSFRGKELEYVLNKTNAQCLLGMFGRRTGGWIGKRVTFAPQMVQAWGEQKLAIRIIGSPDIDKDMSIVIDLGQTKGRKVMKKTTGAATAAAPPQEEEPLDVDDLPEHDPETGELASEGDSESVS